MTPDQEKATVGTMAKGGSAENSQITSNSEDPSLVKLDGRFGAYQHEWQHFSETLGLTQDLLPVVSNQDATISQTSKLKALGKTPTRYDSKGEVIGIPKWPQKRATPADVSDWSKQPDYGICVSTRKVRAVDADIGDFEEAIDVEAFIRERLGIALPVRRRNNSTKFLIPFIIPGDDLTKRRFKTKTKDSFIEFLALGQQFVAIGVHPSGTRYSWDGGLPDVIPELSRDEFEALWTALHATFGSEESVTTRTGNPDRDMTKNINGAPDPVVDYLYEKGLVIDVTASGDICVDCPGKHLHSSDSGPSETIWQPAGTDGYAVGHYKCMHESCKTLISNDRDFLAAIGYLAHGFDVIDIPDTDYHRVDTTPPAPPATIDLATLFADLILTDEDVSKMADAEFLIDNLIVRSSLHAFIAPANGGKTTLFIHLCEELAARGLQIYYVNADANPSDLKRHQAHAKAHGYAVLAPDAKAGMGPIDIITRLKKINESANDLSDFVLILDTLKKFANMIDKNKMRALLALLRGLSAKGATVCLLGHTNKRVEDDGNHIFEGTGDLRNDVDNLIYLESSKDETTKRQEITTRPDKVRAAFVPISYVIDINDNRKVSKCGFVLPVLDKDARAVMEAAKALLQKRGSLAQTLLVKYIKEQLPGFGDKKITGYLRPLAFGDSRIFDTKQGDNNALLYSMRGRVTAEGLDDLSDQGNS